MNLAAMRNVVTGKLGLKILAGKRHAPLILFGIGVVGVVAASVMACRATLKIESVLDDADAKIAEAKTLHKIEEGDRNNEAYNKAVAKIYFKAGLKIAGMYAPAVLLTAVSIGALTGSHVMLTNRYANAAAAYTALDKGFRAYRSRVVEKLGADQDLEFRHGFEEIEIVEEAADGSGPIVKTIRRAPQGKPSIYAEWFEEGSRMWKDENALNYVFLKSQQEHWNWKLQHDGYVILNDVYYALGIPRRDFGYVVGWTKDAHEKGTGDGYIDFGVFDAKTEGAKAFMNGWNKSVLIDPNVDGDILAKIKNFEPY